MNFEAAFSSKTDMWETPQEFFDALNDEFHFALDTCAIPENAKCQRYITPEQDGLAQDWDKQSGGGACWCNPPYGRTIGKWIRKAAEARSTVVLLIPARTDTAWFHDYIYGKAEIRFVRGRLKFGGRPNETPGGSTTWASCWIPSDRRRANELVLQRGGAALCAAGAAAGAAGLLGSAL